jgi:hypothetical protein
MPIRTAWLFHTIGATLLRGGLAFLFLSSLSAPDARATKFAGEFLAIGVGPRALGMGGAFTGVADDGTAGYWNPAGLAGLPRRTAAVMHSEQITGLAYDYIAYAHPRGRGDRTMGFGVSLIRLGVDDIPVTRLPDPFQPIDALLANGQRNRPYIERFISNVEYALLLSVARRSSARFAVGGNLKFVRKAAGEASAFGVGLDAGILVQPVSSLKFGVQVMNLTSTVLTWNTGRKEYITPVIKTGAGYEWAHPRLHGSLLMAADVDVLFEGRQRTAAVSLGRASLSGHVGLEYRLQHTVTLRGGYDASGVTAGAGVRVPAIGVFGRTLIPSLDYAFVNDTALGAVHRIGASLEF